MAQLDHNRLPDEVIRPTTRRRVAGTIVGTLVAMFLVNAGFGWYLSQSRYNFGYWLLSYKWKLLEETEESADWLIIGDSSGNQGVDTTIVEATLGGSALNLCVPAHFMVLNDALILEEYLKDHAPPRGLIVVHVYDVWRREMTLPLWARMPAAVADGSDIQPQCARGWRNQVRLFLYRHVPLDSQTRTLGKLLKGRLPGAVLADVAFRKGFMAMDDAWIEAVENDSAGHIARVQADPTFEISDENAAALRRVVELAEEHDFPVFIALSPLYEAIWAEPRFRAHLSAGLAQLQQIAPPDGRVHYVFDEPVTFPAEQMQNADHVTAAGAKRYTEELVGRLRATAACEPVESETLSLFAR